MELPRRRFLQLGLVVLPAPAVPTVFGARRRNPVVLHDRFALHPDGPLAGTTLLTGQPWGVDGDPPQDAVEAAPRVVGGRYVCRVASPASTFASYLYAAGGEQSSVTARFVFGPGTTSRAAVGVIVSRRAAPSNGVQISSSSCHLAITPSVWEMSFYQDEIRNTTAGGSIDPELTADGSTAHAVKVTRVSDKITIKLPNDETHVVIDPRVAALWGPTVLLECYRPYESVSTDKEPMFAEVIARKRAPDEGG